MDVLPSYLLNFKKVRHHRQQNKCYPKKCKYVKKKKLEHSIMKFDSSNKFDLCYYGQANSLLLKSSVASK